MRCELNLNNFTGRTTFWRKNFPLQFFVFISSKPPLLIPNFILVFPTANFIPETIKQSIYFA